MPEVVHKLPKDFKRLVWSYLSAQLSEQLALSAAPLVAVLVLKSGAVGTGLLQTAQTLPFLLFSLPAGMLADRYAQKQVMLAGEVLRTLALLLVMVLLFCSAMDLWWLAVLGFLGVIGTVVYSVAAPVMVPRLVTGDQLQAANRSLELSRSLAYAGGPAIGGAIVGALGAPFGYVAATVFALLSMVLLLGLKQNYVRDAGTPSAAGLKKALVFCFQHVYLRPLFFTGMVFSLSWFVLQGIFVVWAVKGLGMTATGVGLVLGWYGAGMVVGAFCSTYFTRYFRLGLQILLGPLTAFMGSLVMLSTVWLHYPVLAGLAYFLFGAGPVIWSITTTTLRQRVTPASMLGRVSAILLLSTFGCRPFGALLGTLVAACLGVSACLMLSALGFSVQLMVIWFSRVPGLTKLPEGS